MQPMPLLTVISIHPLGRICQDDRNAISPQEPLRVYEGREVSGRFQLRPLGRRAIELRLQIAGRPPVRQFLKR